MVFKDRVETGQKLAEALSKYQGQENTIVYTLPRGGVVVGAEIAKKLSLPLELVLIQKIGHPMNPEYAICAASESGHVLCSDEGTTGLSQDWLEDKIWEERQEITRRHKLYLSDRQIISAEGKTALIVDDGIATGMSIMSAIHELQHQGAGKTVVAIPIGPQDVINQIKTQADEVIVLHIPSDFTGSVGSYYEDFYQVSDKEVIQLLSGT